MPRIGRGLSIIRGVPLRPAPGEIFELEIDSSKPWNNPKAMPRATGDPRWDEWDFTGRLIEGVQKRRFKLEMVGGCSNIDEVLESLKGKGVIPEGQWIVPFQEKYRLDTQYLVGVSDPSWLNEYGEPTFPSLGASVGLLLHHADDIRRGGEYWLWLVEVVD